MDNYELPFFMDNCNIFTTAQNIYTQALLTDQKFDVLDSKADELLSAEIKDSGALENLLCEVAELGFLPIIKKLLSSGVNPSTTNSSGETPLFLATRGGHLGVIKLLLESDPSVIDVANDDGITPLMNICSTDFLGIVDFLLEHGADPTIKDKKGRTFIDYLKHDYHREKYSEKYF